MGTGKVLLLGKGVVLENFTMEFQNDFYDRGIKICAIVFLFMSFFYYFYML